MCFDVYDPLQIEQVCTRVEVKKDTRGSCFLVLSYSKDILRRHKPWMRLDPVHLQTDMNRSSLVSFSVQSQHVYCAVVLEDAENNEVCLSGGGGSGGYY